jgi:tRNA(Ile)-lysidine synthetase-like protein
VLEVEYYADEEQVVALPNIPDRVKRFIDENQLFTHPQTLVVGVSGGADSVCLLHLLDSLSEHYRLRLHVAHLNHRLRGLEAEADAHYVQTLARKLHLPFTISAADVRSYQTEHSLSPELAARQVRYAFLADVARSVGAERVAVGHTADDQVETVAIHWLRGSGLAGLRGMRPAAPIFRLAEADVPDFEEDGTDSDTPSQGPLMLVVRPLLALWRRETGDYCKQFNLKPRSDSSNDDLRLRRNKVRHQLIPALEVYNPEFKQNVWQSSLTYAAEYDYLEAQVDALWPRLATVGNGVVRLDGGVWRETPLALQPYCLRRAVLTIVGHVEGLERVHIDAALGADGPARARMTLPHGLVMLREPDGFVVGLRDGLEQHLRSLDRNFAPQLVSPAALLVEPPASVALPFSWQAEFAWAAPPANPAAVEHFEAYLDVSAFSPPFILRGRLPGERIAPLGLHGQSKALQDIMVDEKIATHLRASWPLLVATDPELGEQPLWVVGLTVSELARVTPQSERVLHVRFSNRLLLQPQIKRPASGLGSAEQRRKRMPCRRPASLQDNYGCNINSSSRCCISVGAH